MILVKDIRNTIDFNFFMGSLAMGSFKQMLQDMEETEAKIFELKKQKRKIAKKLNLINKELTDLSNKLENLKTLTKTKCSE